MVKSATQLQASFAVSKIASAKTVEQQNAELNAAKKCRTAPLKDQIGAAPKTYRNFGACVSAQVKKTS